MKKAVAWCSGNRFLYPNNMEIHHYLKALKHKIQRHGALRDEAWLLICSSMQHQVLQPNERFIQKDNQLAYVASGLFKEYSAYERTRPSIINLIPADSCFITRRHSQQDYLKAATTSLTFSWNFESLMAIYRDYRELKPVYEIFCSEYNTGLAYRSLILETPEVAQRIRYLKAEYGSLIPYLKKKEMANYLHLNYNHFIKVFNGML